MTLRSASAVGMLHAALLAIAIAPFGSEARASDLTVALPTGPLGQALEKAFVEPFQHATGLALATARTDGGIAAGKAAGADIVAITRPAVDAGCKAGQLVKLDWNALGGRDRQLAGTATDCGEGAAVRGTVLAWNRAKFPGTPGWGDFWDVAKVPGKRGLHRGARMNLELALMADGVAAADVYATLRSDGGVDRAFRKLDQLKPYLVWWQSDAEAARLLLSGDVLMTSAPVEEIVAAQRGTEGRPPQPGLAMQWMGCLITVENWAALSGAKAATPAGRFLAYAADPKNQKSLPAQGGYGGAAQGANDGLPPALLSVSPSAPANLQSSLMVDEQFWAENGAKLDRLFEAWISR